MDYLDQGNKISLPITAITNPHILFYIYKTKQANRSNGNITCMRFKTKCKTNLFQYGFSHKNLPAQSHYTGRKN